MKKRLLISLFSCLPLLGTAQVFQENFDGDGPGIDAWTVLDLDGNTVAPPVSEITDAWVAIDRGGPAPNYGGPDGDFAAASTSFYIPDGIANDWLISPEFTVTGESPYLVWDAKGTDPRFLDGYKVMLAPSAGDSPEDFSVELFSTEAENFDWTTRHVDLSAYLDQTVRIAFVNNSENKFVLLIDNILVDEYTPAPVPDCTSLNLPVDGATEVEFTEGVLFSWEPVGDTEGIEYDFYLDMHPNPTTLIGTTSETSVTVSGITHGGTTHYWKVVPKNTSGEASDCNEFSFTTLEMNVAPYCGPLNFSFNVEPISYVSFGGMTNESDADLNNSPAHEVFLDQVANVTPGTTETIVIKGNTNGPWENYLMVFIDWNQDGDFDDENETYTIPTPLAGSNGLDDVQVSYDIEVPSDALRGNTRMRVKKNFGPQNLENPCVGGSFGQAEDYTVNVGSLSVHDVDLLEFSYYPNPVKDILTFKTNQSLNEVSVYDAMGKFLMNKKFTNSEYQLDLSHLPTGVYTLVASLENKTKTFKVVKK
ncbi:T9SS type A sorting domain-containing protein [Weeksellaceae bacterium KMM 9713]|uniref:T9SS type A sorting domain-containing protein n=1 Tax=Profundicola chukchiensis TaxID=2961959 RepID=A0A9X4MZ83_9FLAO|nr:choice-of-anchor J domain-containing protein [Profundicola chukchiensis]MDG4945692.1 T9SS type A sorting domain-containing protein [Profundicola chukchiensis]